MFEKKRPYYADPTANAAIGKVMKEYREKQKEISNRQYEIRHRPKVYIVSRYAGDVKTNVNNARRYCRFAVMKQMNPLASHLLYPQFLDDNKEQEREIGLQYGLALLKICDEVWCFGTEKSDGMEKELAAASRQNKRIRYFTEDMEEIV